MDPAELDLAVSELETRLERLRSLYEQYFLGIEKLPPHVARKDVDRRIWELKRVKIRNTAKRFKLQTIIQRYNTFQQYWQRILREIENGTYKRHVLRAERATARTREEATAPQERPSEEARPEPQDPMAGADLGRLLDSETDLDAELQRALAEASAPGRPAQPVARQTPVEPAEPQPARPVARRKVETLDLDMDGFDFAPKTAVRRSTVEREPASPSPASPDPAAAPAPAAVARPGAQPTVARAKPAAPRAQPTAAASPPVARAKPTAVARAAQPAPRRPPRARPAAAAARANPLAALGANTPEASPPRAKPPVSVRETEARARPKPAAPPANKPPARPQAAANKGISDQRIAELHNRLVDAKRQTKEGGKVSVKGLAKSLRAAESKLRKQHKNRRIDFDVVIKDGRAVVKPFVR